MRSINIRLRKHPMCGILSDPERFDMIFRAVEEVRKLNRYGELSISSERFMPPRWAEFLIMILTDRTKIEGRIGDLEEVFHTHVLRFGLTRARRMYWVEALRTSFQLLWPEMKRLVFGAAAIAGFKKWMGH